MKKILLALLGIATMTSAMAESITTVTLKDKRTISYPESSLDSIVYIGGEWGEPGAIGMKVYMSNGVCVDFLFSQVTDVTVAGETPDPTDTNKNRNQLSRYYDKSKKMYGLEWPRINETDRCSWVSKNTTQYGNSFSLEWSNSKIANRWTCYQLYASNIVNNNVSRSEDFREDEELPAATRSTLDDYRSSGYSRGHLCPSADRRCSEEQNSQTFYLSNMQPQWQSHNAGLWLTLENQVRNWVSNCDTLYVVKAATIDDVTLDGTTSSGIYDAKCNNRLPVAKYFYSALLAVKNGKYQALGLWTIHKDDAQSSTTLKSCAITIDELERRTGIDFFCNLPDDVEDATESVLNLSFWGL